MKFIFIIGAESDRLGDLLPDLRPIAQLVQRREIEKINFVDFFNLHLKEKFGLKLSNYSEWTIFPGYNKEALIWGNFQRK
jgi:hypothetical protein